MSFGKRSKAILEEHTQRVWEIGRLTGMAEALTEVATRFVGNGLSWWISWKIGQIKRELIAMEAEHDHTT